VLQTIKLRTLGLFLLTQLLHDLRFLEQKATTQVSNKRRNAFHDKRVRENDSVAFTNAASEQPNSISISALKA